MTDHADVAATVRNAIVDCLAVDEADVTPEANFFHDLGGESIDALDIGFRLQQAYGIQLHFQQVSAVDKSAINEHGRLTAVGLDRFRQRYPFVEVPAEAAEGVSPRDLFTVGFIMQAVEQALAAKESGRS
jgi:acyl carrier protein